MSFTSRKQSWRAWTLARVQFQEAELKETHYLTPDIFWLFAIKSGVISHHLLPIHTCHFEGNYGLDNVTDTCNVLSLSLIYTIRMVLLLPTQLLRGFIVAWSGSCWFGSKSKTAVLLPSMLLIYKPLNLSDVL